MTDPRIVYGAHCTWWDSINEVATRPTASGHFIPCCPHCKNVLFEMSSLEEWNRRVDAHIVKSGDASYRSFVEWLRGRCYPLLAQAKLEYEKEKNHGQ